VNATRSHHNLTLVDVLDVGAVDVRAVLEDELLEEQEGALVVHVLPDLRRVKQ